jgi:predicted TIM-barrel fold metal-dependent hydrolase
MLGCQSNPSASTNQGISYHGDPNADSRKTLLLKDFKPQTRMHSKVHLIDRAHDYVIDVHSHINDAAGIHAHQDPKKVIARMDKANVRTVFILTGLWGEKLQKVIDEMVKPYPGRFVVFTQLDWARVDESSFVPEMIQLLRDSAKRGANGLKLLKDFGLNFRHKNGELVKIDDPRFDPIWDECAKLKFPVFIHTTDPEAFFHPIDATNERYEELVENPDWSFPPDKFPSKESLLAARDQIFARHPRTQFVALHMANWPENLDYIDGLLAKYPNVAVEFGARVAELGRQPKRTRALFEKYQDRILFGSDFEQEDGMYANHFRWLETNDEYFDYWGAPGQGRWKIYGLGLPPKILAKIYHGNAERLFHVGGKH